MRSRITLIIASLFGALSIYCAQGAVAPERNANADGSSGGSSGAACCDTTPKWTKITETSLTGKNGAGTSYSEAFDVSGYKELSIIRKCEASGANAYVYPSWGADNGGLFGNVGVDGVGRFPVVAPFMKVSVSSDRTETSVTCNVVVLGIK